MFEISLPPKFVSSIALSSFSCLNLAAPKITLRERRNGDGQSLGGARELEKNVGTTEVDCIDIWTKHLIQSHMRENSD